MSHLHGIISNVESQPQSQLARPLTFGELEDFTTRLTIDTAEDFARDFQNKAEHLKRAQGQTAENDVNIQKIAYRVDKLNQEFNALDKQLDEDMVRLSEMSKSLDNFQHDYAQLPSTSETKNCDRDLLYKLFVTTEDFMLKARDIPEHTDLVIALSNKKKRLTQLLDMHECILRTTDQNLKQVETVSAAVQTGLDEATKIVMSHDRDAADRRLCRCDVCTNRQ